MSGLAAFNDKSDSDTTPADDLFGKSRISRRQILVSGAAAVFLGGCASNTSHSQSAATKPTNQTTVTPTSLAAQHCQLTPELTAGPYYIDGPLMRKDITEGRPGMPVTFRVTVLNQANCAPLKGAAVDIWHCDAGGEYSGFNGNTLDKTNAQGTNTKRFLRGVQLTDANGIATFTTIFPGWYEGRAVHIHLKVHEAGTAGKTYTGGHIAHIGQAFFDEELTRTILATGAYMAHTGTRTTNEQDSIYKMGGTGIITKMTELGGDKGYRGDLTCTIDPNATPKAAPLF